MSTLTRNDLRGLAKEYQEIIIEAQRLHWTAHRLSGGGVRITSPDGEYSQTLPNSRSADPNRVRNIRKQIVKHGTGPLVQPVAEALMDAVEVKEAQEQLTQVIATTLPPANQCADCGQFFTTKRGLNIHRGHRHNGSPVTITRTKQVVAEAGLDPNAVILQTIRGLLDDGETERLQARIAELEAEVAALRTEREALRDLLS